MSKKCVFERSDTYCSVLVIKQCLGCNFCKTPEQLEESRKRSEARINSLHNRAYIKGKYGNTNRMYNEEEER